MRFLKQLFCKHSFEFAYNLYGDQIIEYGYKRSVWTCSKCGKWTGRDDLFGCSETGDSKKDPQGCWNVRCQLGKRCCRKEAVQ